MNVILLEDVEKVGLRGDVVSVARGYARNYLFPRKRHEAKSADEAQAIAAKLAATELRFEMKAGPTGSLFGSVTPTDIADELWSTSKIRVDRRKIGIDNLKRIGRYEVPIDLFQDVQVEVKLVVVPEGGELPSEDELEAMAAAERAEEEAAALPAEEPAYEELAEEEPAVPAAEAEPEPEWRADADAAALHRE